MDKGDYVLRYETYVPVTESDSLVLKVGDIVGDCYWPVIRKGAEAKIVAEPTVAELQSEIATLKAKVAEQAEALGKIKKIVS